MAQSTVDIQKMKSVANELDKIYSSINTQIKNLGEQMSQLDKLWKGDAAQAYQKSYQQNTANFQQLAQAISSCSQTLTGIAGTYGKADTAASEAIKAKMGGRR